jgi:CRISPR/Cas system-associated endoribonuclease Cas2
MPLEDDYDDLSKSKKTGLKKVSSKKSMFDGAVKKTTQKDLEERVKDLQEKDHSFKARTDELAIKFKKILNDKTLAKNKSVFVVEMEREVLSSILQLAAEVNSHPDELEGMGSLSWIAQLFKVSLSQRDRMNNLEFAIYTLEEKIKNLSALDNVKRNG